jgi:hypothetical protein
LNLIKSIGESPLLPLLYPIHRVIPSASEGSPS